MIIAAGCPPDLKTDAMRARDSSAAPTAAKCARLIATPGVIKPDVEPEDPKVYTRQKY